MCTINIDSVLINNKMRCPVRDPENKSLNTVFYSRPIYAKIPLCSQTDKHKNCLRMIYIALLCLRPTTNTTGDTVPYLLCSINKIFFSQGYDVTNYKHYMCLHFVTSYFVSNHL